MSAIARFLDDAQDASEDEILDDEESNVAGELLSYVFLFGLIFGLSATVEIRKLRHQLNNKFAIGTGVAMQFFIMPILGYLSVVSFRHHGFDKPMGIALLVVTSSPGGSYSNWWCSTFNAELSLSVAMTTVSSLLSMGMLPANLLFYSFLAYGREEEQSVLESLNYSTIFVALGIVLAAIVLGLAAGYYYDTPQFHKQANQLGSVSGLLLILFSVFIQTGADGSDEGAFDYEWSFYVAVAFPCLVGISLANMIARALRLTKPETVAIGIECCYQNTGIGTSVAIAMYSNRQDRARAVAVPLFYGIVEAVAIGLYCVWAWKAGWTKAPPDEAICTVVTRTYEIPDDNDPPNAHHLDDHDTLAPSHTDAFRDDATLRDASLNTPQAATLAQSAVPNPTGTRTGWKARLAAWFGSRSSKEFQPPPRIVLDAVLDEEDGRTAPLMTPTSSMAPVPPVGKDSGVETAKDSVETEAIETVASEDAASSPGQQVASEDAASSPGQQVESSEPEKPATTTNDEITYPIPAVE